MSHRNDRTLAVRALARVEGEGAMHVRVRGGAVEDVRLEIYEPPRFFEAFLRGRQHTEPPDITARICGICPVAYQMSACAAMETACGVEVGGQLRALRRLLYCGEWIESHALHVYMLHLPDFLGYESAIELARDNRDAVAQALELKKIGNELMTGFVDQGANRELGLGIVGGLFLGKQIDHILVNDRTRILAGEVLPASELGRRYAEGPLRVAA